MPMLSRKVAKEPRFFLDNVHSLLCPGHLACWHRPGSSFWSAVSTAKLYRNNSNSYSLHLHLKFLICRTQKHAESVGIECSRIGGGFFLHIFEGRGVGRVIAWEREHGPQFCILQSSPIFNVNSFCYQGCIQLCIKQNYEGVNTRTRII